MLKHSCVYGEYGNFYFHRSTSASTPTHGALERQKKVADFLPLKVCTASFGGRIWLIICAGSVVLEIHWRVDTIYQVGRVPTSLRRTNIGDNFKQQAFLTSSFCSQPAYTRLHSSHPQKAKPFSCSSCLSLISRGRSVRRDIQIEARAPNEITFEDNSSSEWIRKQSPSDVFILSHATRH